MTQTVCCGSDDIFSEDSQSSKEVSLCTHSASTTTAAWALHSKLFTCQLEGSSVVTGGGCLRQQEILLLPSSAWLSPAMGTAPAAERTWGW